jgi:hypothetical protein
MFNGLLHMGPTDDDDDGAAFTTPIIIKYMDIQERP